MSVHDFVTENKALHLEVSMAVSQANRYKELWVQSCARYNRLQVEHKIAMEALRNIEEHNQLSPAQAADVAVMAFYEIGQLEGEKI